MLVLGVAGRIERGKRLKELVAEQALDIAILKEAAAGNF